MKSGISINGTTRNELSKKEYDIRIHYGICPVCLNWRIIKVKGGHYKEDKRTGEKKWVSSGYYHTCGSVEGEMYEVQKTHYVLQSPSKKSKIYEYMGK